MIFGVIGLWVFCECFVCLVIVLFLVMVIVWWFVFGWGLYCVVSEDVFIEDDMIDCVCCILYMEGWVKFGQCIIVMVGVFFGIFGLINMLWIVFVGSDGQGGI